MPEVGAPSLVGLRVLSVPAVEGVAGQGHLPNLLGVVVVQVGLASASSREAQSVVVPGVAHGRWWLVCTLVALNGPVP